MMTQSIKFGRGYCDLNIPLCDGNAQTSTIDLIRRALLLGYETIAINTNVNQRDLLSKGRERHKAKKAKTDNGTEQELGLLDFLEPPNIKLSVSDYPDLAAKNKAPVILTRLTLTFSNNDFLPIFNTSKAVDKYDLLALCPTSALALQNLLKSNFRADIITFDPEGTLAGGSSSHSGPDSVVRWSRKLYMECVDKYMYFELPYAPAIRDSTARRRIIRQAHIYHAVGKSKKIIMASNARHVLELRGPHDVANLGHLFGLNEEQGKSAVSKMGIEVVQSSAGRKIGPYRAVVQRIEDLPEEERWKIPNSNNEGESKQSSDSDDSSSSDNNTKEKVDESGQEVGLKVYD